MKLFDDTVADVLQAEIAFLQSDDCDLYDVKERLEALYGALREIEELKTKESK